MKKLLRRIVRLILLLLAGILLYVACILLINTASDYKPEGGSISTLKFNHLKPASTDDTLSVLSWNIGYAGLGGETDFFYDGGSMSRPEKEDFLRYQAGILENLKVLGEVNFFLLQEVDINSKRSYNSNQYDLIEGHLPLHKGFFVKNYDVAFVPMPVFHPMGNVESGISLFSNKKAIESSWGAYDMDKSWPLGLFLPDRCYSVTIFETDTTGSLYVFNTHNSAFDDGSQRDSQLEQLYAEMIKAFEEGNYVIAGGDWNLNPCDYKNVGFESGDIPFIMNNLQVVCGPNARWQIAYDPAYPTNRDLSSPYENGKTYTSILDFFVCSPNISILETTTLYDGFANSDHHAVYLRCKLD